MGAAVTTEKSYSCEKGTVFPENSISTLSQCQSATLYSGTTSVMWIPLLGPTYLSGHFNQLHSSRFLGSAPQLSFHPSW
jgi:hypothetical protein